MTAEERKNLASSYLGKVVTIKIDRPKGFVHTKNNVEFTYPINYGYIPGVIGGDGEELDVYLLLVDEPLEEYTGEIIGIVYRKNDNEDKLVMAPRGTRLSQKKIAEQVYFREQYYKTEIDSLLHVSCGALVYRKRNIQREYLCLLQKHSQTYSAPKGHMEAFETEEQTAERELSEEIGIMAKFHPNFKKSAEYDISRGRRKKVVLFLTECVGEPNINYDEISREYWLGSEEAKKILPEWYGSVIDDAEKLLKSKV